MLPPSLILRLDTPAITTLYRIVVLVGIAALPSTFAASAGSLAQAYALPATDEGRPGAGPIRRDDSFQRVWQEQRSGWAKRAEQDRGAIVFVGDGTLAGLSRGFSAASPGVKVASRALPGDTTRGVLWRLEEDVLALDPAAVVLLVGGEDLEQGATPEIAAENVRLMVDKL